MCRAIKSNDGFAINVLFQYYGVFIQQGTILSRLTLWSSG